MKSKASIVIIAIILSTLGSLLIFNNILNRRINRFYQPSFFEHVVEDYYSVEYKGKVVNVYIDKSQHNFKKVDILEVDQVKTIRWDYEKPDVFNFITIGDSLIKKRNSLYFNLKRQELDTIIELKFENIKGYDEHEDFLNTLKNDG